MTFYRYFQILFAPRSSVSLFFCPLLAAFISSHTDFKTPILAFSPSRPVTMLCSGTYSNSDRSFATTFHRFVTSKNLFLKSSIASPSTSPSIAERLIGMEGWSKSLSSLGVCQTVPHGLLILTPTPPLPCTHL